MNENPGYEKEEWNLLIFNQQAELVYLLAVGRESSLCKEKAKITFQTIPYL